MRALVTWGSKRGGTEGIGRIVAEALSAKGFEVVATAAHEARDPRGFDAVLIGGALYAGRWAPEARRFVDRNVKVLRTVPVWLFSSGPLDDSAEREPIPPTDQVAVLAERIGAQGHVTFGGRLASDAQGFPASAMAKTAAGDWRNPDRIRAWASQVATEIPTAKPRPAVEPAARSIPRLVIHGLAGWAACGATMLGSMQTGSLTAALVLHAIAAPLIFAALAWHYFRARGAREPLPIAIVWTAMVMLLDAVVVAGLIERSAAMFTSFAGTWLPFALIFLATWITGLVAFSWATVTRQKGPPGRDAHAAAT